jgi:hypothetical protein
MKLTNLKSNPNNPRIIKDEKFKKLVKSIKDFPEMMEKRPIICVTDVDGKLYPLGGNMRLKALQELNFKEIPDNWVMLADSWTQEQRKEFVIKDNVGFGEWDWDNLANEWDAEKLDEWGLDVPGFDNIDFSEKNKEININDLDSEMTIKLNFVESDYWIVKEKLSKIAATPEQAIFKLLGLNNE